MTDITNLNNVCKKIRKYMLEQRYKVCTGHLAGPMGIVEILVVLYYKILKNNPEAYMEEDRDRFILSGYQYPALYGVLAMKNYFPENWLSEMDIFMSRLKPNKTLPGIEISAYASLGQGLSIANGICMALKLKQNTSSYVYVLLGDGEMNEGQVWEALCTSIHYKINNLMIIINRNHVQNDGKTKDIMNINLKDSLLGLGFPVEEVDGYDLVGINNKINELKNIYSNEPKVLICNTIKGKGVKFIENDFRKYHACRLTEDEFLMAIGELDNGI